MQPWKGLTGLCLLGLLTVGSSSADAAWNNVFQVCCHRCRPSTSNYLVAPPVVSYSAPASACSPSVSYVQRCYYEPVTTYKQQVYYEPVTTYRTSYYYEPVTSYRYTSYYDPCTGCCQQLCQPVTSYRLRAQCNAVTSYVQRCQMVPVTSYRQTCCYQPVVTYSPPVCPTACPTCSPVAPTQPAISEGQGQGLLPPQQIPPAVGESRQYAPAITENGTSSTNGLLAPQNLPQSQGYRPPTVRPPLQTTPPPLAPAPRMDRVASAPSGAMLQGTIVANDQRTPLPGAKLLFVHSQPNGGQHAVASDAAGRFQVHLPAGEWLIYLASQQGQPVYHSRIALNPSQVRTVTVASR